MNPDQPTPRAPEACACRCALCGEVRCPSCHNLPASDRPGQPGKNEGDRVGLVGRASPTSPSSPGRDDLRERVAALIWSRATTITERATDAFTDEDWQTLLIEDEQDEWRALAAAVLAVVEPALAQRGAEIERLRDRVVYRNRAPGYVDDGTGEQQ